MSSDLVVPIVLLANSILTVIAVWSFIDAVIDSKISSGNKKNQEEKDVIKL
jgi:hypothetical protein